jgi:hypothetical protein
MQTFLAETTTNEFKPTVGTGLLTYTGEWIDDK